MEKKIIDGVEYYLPECNQDVQSLVKQAYSNEKKIRVRGAYHSVHEAIDPDSKKDLFVILAKMNRVCINEKDHTVVVEAGCHLGCDPLDPTKISTIENSLFAKLDAAGYAMPDMGGIIHQTVAGFLSTGASGSNMRRSFDDALRSLTFIPANNKDPQPITVNIDDDDPLFYAAGVSMGLLGIIVSATFSLELKFDIEGKETITKLQDCAIDMLGAGTDPSKMSLHKFMMETDFKRILWYPQPRVSKVVVWEAKKLPPEQKVEKIKKYEKKPYEPLPIFFNSRIPIQLVANFIYTCIGKCPRWLAENNWFNKIFYKWILPFILKFFVPIEKDENGKPKPQKFDDHWYSSLPMDNKINDELIPVKFAELWIPFNDDPADNTISGVLKELNNIFASMYQNEMGPIPDGTFCIELVSARKSDFWMSPAYKTHALRVGIFWFGKNAGNPNDQYFPIFWNGLAAFNYRVHWGKYLPKPDGPQGVNYLKKQFHHWDDFMLLRQQYDPNDIFLTKYWKEHLGIHVTVLSKLSAAT